MKEFDIIVVGGGPGGSTAALFAAKAGLKTLFVDKSKFPRDKVCGDAVSGKSLRILRKLNLINKIENIPQIMATGVVFSSPKGEFVRIPFRSANGNTLPGYVSRRFDYDNFLFQQAKSQVALCFENFKITDLLKNGNQVTGIRGHTKDDNHSEDYTAKVIIGADGYKSFIAQNLGLYHYDSKHTLVALRAYYQNVSGLSDYIEIHYVKESLPGYFWIFPLPENMSNVGIGMRHVDIKKKNIAIHEVLDNVINSPTFKERFNDAKLIGKIKGWNLPVGSIFRPNYADGVLLIGDAAGLIDPFTGEGIGNAMTSAELAIQVAEEAISQNDTSHGNLSRYDRLLKDMLGSELNLSYQLQKIGRRFPFLLNMVIGKAARKQEIAEWVSSMIADEKSKKDLTSPLTYFKMLLT